MSDELKNVVVVGLGVVGAKMATDLAKALPATHRVVGITESPFAYWPISSLRSSVVPGWEEKNTRNVAGLFGAGSRHVVLGGTKVLSIDHDLHTLRVDTDNRASGFSTSIPFDYLIIATGSVYPFPARPPPGAGSIEDVIASNKKFQNEVGASTSVLVVGAGATGVEYAGEVAAQFPKKSVTLVSAADSLFNHPNFNPKFGKTLAGQLKELNVKLEFGARLDLDGLSSGPIQKRTFHLSNGSTVTADYLLLATGNKPNSSLIAKFDSSAVDDSQHIKVRDTLQLANSSYSHIFAVGDVTNRPENKSAVTGGNHVPIVVANITALIKGASNDSLKKHKTGGIMMVVTVGPANGAGQVFGWVLGGWMARMAKSKTLLTEKFVAEYPALVK